MQMRGFTPEEIEEALAAETGPERPEPPLPQASSSSSDSSLSLDGTQMEPEEDEFADQLTDADRIMLRLKWGKGYTAE